MSFALFPEIPSQYLKQEYSLRLQRRPHYSLRAFSRDLGLSPSTLTDLMKDRLGLSRQRILELSEKLKLSELQRDHWIDITEYSFSKKELTKKNAFLRIQTRVQKSNTKLDLDVFQFISDWQHLAILELSEISENHNISYFSKKLGIPETIISESIQRLEKLNLIKNENGKWIPTEGDSVVGNQVPSSAIRMFHTQMIQKALDSVEEQTLEERELRSSLLSISKSDLPEFKKDINNMIMELMVKYSAKKNKDSVYGFNVQLFNVLKEDSHEK